MANTGDGRTPRGSEQFAPERSEPSRQGRYRRIREKARQSTPLDLTWRFGVLIVGIAVVIAGVVMLVLPGPGWAAIILGLVILATEFWWAERVLGVVKSKAVSARDRALDPAARRRNLILLGIASVVVIVGVVLYVAKYGV